MKRISVMIFIMAAAIFISSNTVFAQDGNYSARNITTDKNGGYNFAVPAGWTKEEGDGGFGMINPAKTVVVAIKAHNYKDFGGFMANLNLEGEGLQQINRLRRKWARLFAPYNQSPDDPILAQDRYSQRCAISCLEHRLAQRVGRSMQQVGNFNGTALKRSPPNQGFMQKEP